jgi:hypothetical protein
MSLDELFRYTERVALVASRQTLAVLDGHSPNELEGIASTVIEENIPDILTKLIAREVGKNILDIVVKEVNKARADK